MAMAYIDVSRIEKMLKVAHDPRHSPIRAKFFEKEYRFFHRHIQNQVVLVAGSGLGHDTFELASNNKHVIGIEILPPLVQLAQLHARQKHITHVEFRTGDILDLKTRLADTSVLNMGTIGNFSDHNAGTPGTVSDRERVIRALLKASDRLFLDFYPPTSKGIYMRQKMYTEEGWRHVTIEGTAIKNPDGLYSVSIAPEELSALAQRLHLHIEFYDLCEFAKMACFSKPN